MSTVAPAPQKKGGSKQNLSKKDIGWFHSAVSNCFKSKNEEETYYRDAAHILFHYYNIMEKGDDPNAALKFQQQQQSYKLSKHVPTRVGGSGRKQSSILEFIESRTGGEGGDRGCDGGADGIAGAGAVAGVVAGVGADCAETSASGPAAAPAAEGGASGGDAQSKYSGMSRGELLESYMRVLNGRLPSDAPRPVSDRNHAGPTNLGMTSCKHCGTAFRSLVAAEGYLVCDKCDTVEYVNIDNDKPSYGDPPREISYFCYKRQNHFQEWISQTQGREYTNIPQSVYDAIFEELARQKIHDVNTLSPKRMKSVMKKLSLNKYYEHIPHIINHMSGTPLARIPPELEAQLRRMFQQIQVPFMRHSPHNRRNFLSYSFVLHKFIQLLGHDELLVNFPLLKSREKLHVQDVIWKRICSDLQWEFIRSV